MGNADTDHLPGGVTKKAVPQTAFFDAQGVAFAFSELSAR